MLSQNVEQEIVTGVKHKPDRTTLSSFPKRQRISADENNNSSTDPIQITGEGGGILKDRFSPRRSGNFPG